jgi:hypothetical protein
MSLHSKTVAFAMVPSPHSCDRRRHPVFKQQPSHAHATLGTTTATTTTATTTTATTTTATTTTATTPMGTTAVVAAASPVGGFFCTLRHQCPGLARVLWGIQRERQSFDMSTLKIGSSDMF